MVIPKISIIVPVYNVDSYLPQCLDSILAQTFTDWEAILVDDGSTDRSGVICDEYAELPCHVRSGPFFVPFPALYARDATRGARPVWTAPRASCERVIPAVG